MIHGGLWANPATPFHFMSIEAFKDQAHTAAEITDEVNAQLPEEKARALREMAATAKDVAAGNVPTSGDGRGQAICSVPPVIYMRWQQEYPGCWKDKSFVDEFLFDNPECQLPGYKPKAKAIHFNMSQSAQINHGANVYREKKAKVMASITQQEAFFNGQR